MKTIIAGLALVLASGYAYAEGVAAGIGIGTLGAGVQLAFALRDDFNLRVGANGLKFSYDYEERRVDYDADVKLANVPLVVDWFPIKGGIFRLSAGIFGNSNKVDLEGRPRSGTFSIGNNVYSATAIGSVTGTVKYRSVAPYVGVGWGNAVQRGKNWGWNLDLGALYQGRPKTSYSVVCGSALSAAQCTQLQNDAAIEADEFDRELRHYRLYPVAQFWLSKQF
jgi:hypothetical protein